MIEDMGRTPTFGPRTPGNPTQPTTNYWLGKLLEKPIEKLKNANDVLNEDAELLEKTASFRGRGESVLAFIARVGISPAQIRAWSHAEIARFVDIVSANERGELPGARMFETKPVPPRFVII
jgi:hypothetical protein